MPRFKKEYGYSCTCDICGEAIYVDDEYYELPDGGVVCDSGDCIDEWLGEYRRLAQPED